MAVTPMIVMAGEMHEFEHAMQADAAVESAMAPAPNPGADGGANHDLAHASQCCSLATALLSAAPALLLRSPKVKFVSLGVSPRDLRVICLVFRPPIAT
ncbi:MAG TPA: hypothetical protein VN324_05775 [Quisquiliibacterium sp.]|nr:hypothetical protein [Quisquiliibacterium sp.]